MQDRIKLEPDMSTETVLRRSTWRGHSSLQDCYLTSAVCSRLLLPWAPFRALRRLLGEADGAQNAVGGAVRHLLQTEVCMMIIQ